MINPRIRILPVKRHIRNNRCFYLKLSLIEDHGLQAMKQIENQINELINTPKLLISKTNSSPFRAIRIKISFLETTFNCKLLYFFERYYHISFDSFIKLANLVEF